MKKLSLSLLWPYPVAVVIFLIIMFSYFSPVLEGQLPRQDDIQRWRGMSKEIADYREKTGEEALWTNSMFGGMPAYQISVIYKGVLVKYIDKIFQLGIPYPISLVFLYFVGFFILLISLRFNAWQALLGATAFTFSSYFFIIIEAGHNSKAHAIGYMAPVLAGILLTYQGKYLLGGAITALFLSLQVMTNHLQITYYLLMTVVILGIVQFFYSLKQKQLPHFFRSTLILVVAAIFAAGVNISNLWATYEYGKYTIRGPSELTSNPEIRTTGLDIDYATQWSYGITETMTLLIPDFMGGGSMRHPSINSSTHQTLLNLGLSESQAAEVLRMIPMYWGTQPFTSGPVYVGAVIVFLFILGLFIVKGPMKWWLLAATILSILLAWGQNLMPVTRFFMHYVPGYNKFRAVSMILVIAELAMPFLGMLALKEIYTRQNERKYLFRSVLHALYITGGICLFFILFSRALFNFSSAYDQQLLQAGFPEQVIQALREDRASLLVSDSLRSLIFIILTASILGAFLYRKINTFIATAALLVLVIADMYPINKRYLNDEDFEEPRRLTEPYTPTPADQFILKDPDPNFRVLNLTVNPFTDARTSYFHKSIGGYHGAKLRRYQELIDHHLSKNNMAVINMLNTKYLIVEGKDKQPTVIPNTDALGHAWIVRNVRIVANADEEIKALDDFNPEETAIIDQRFRSLIEKFQPADTITGTIELISYKPNELIYRYQSSRDELVVFSEIYYDKGWNVYVDGQKMPYLRANYVLRAMMVPAGEHEIVWKFEPRVYYMGGQISLAFSLIVILFFLVAVIAEIRKSHNSA